jgi:hypothetical protein
MMNDVCLAILYTPLNGKPVQVVNVQNYELLLAAAEAAVREAEQRLERWEASDPVLADFHTAELLRVRQLLGELLPEFRDNLSRISTRLM